MAKGSGIVKVQDEDDLEIDALIQRELDALGDEDLLDDSEGLNQLEAQDGSSERNTEVEDPFQSSFSEYLDLLKYNQTKAAEGLIDSEKALGEAEAVDSTKLELIVAEKLKDILDQDDSNDDENMQNYLQLRTKALAEIEELDLKEEKEMLAKDEADHNKLAVAIIGPDVFAEIRQLEEQENKKLQILREKQMLEEKSQNELLLKMKEEENKKNVEFEKVRVLKMQQFEKNLGMSEEKEKELATTKQAEVSYLKEIEEQFQAKLKEIEKEREKEEKEFHAMKAKIEKERQQKISSAALIIQRTYRGHRARRKYRPKLADMKVLRKKQERERLEKLEAEENLQKEAEEKRRLEQEEAERREKERAEREKLEKERLETERVERMRLEKEQEESRRLEREEEEERKRIEEEERIKKERTEEERKERERQEKERLEIERRERERLENERKERELLENERRKRERLEEERKELERQEAERREKERLEIERKEKEKKRIEKERIEKEIAEKRKIEEEKTRREKDENEVREKLIKREQSKKDIEEQGIIQRREKDSNEVLKQEKEKPKENAPSETEIGTRTPKRPELSERLEEIRRTWIENHTRYSESSMQDRSHSVAKRKPNSRFPKSLEALPEISSTQILKSATDRPNLQSCECIVLSGVDGIRMKGIEKCPKLRVIKMTDCNLQAIEGLEKHEYIEKLDLPDNKIDFMSMSTQVSLRHLSLPNNNLSSTNGLDCLPNLEVLDLSSNRITRIGSISLCKKLQNLNLDENQLITLKGIEGIQGLVDLNVSRNYLGNAKEIENLPLLTRLDLHSNTINTLPSFKNHVLLRHLDIHGNSIVSLEPLANVWLPSLQSIHIAGNSIEELPVLDNLIMLSTIDLQDNVIRECSNFLRAIENCRRLLVLKISGNPVVDTPDLRGIIKKALPQLNQLDDMKFEHPATDERTDTDFEELCILQRNERINLDVGYLEDLRKFETLCPYNAELERLEVEKRFRDAQLKLLLRHLQQHENFGKEGDKVMQMTEISDQPYDSVHETAPLSDAMTLTRTEKNEPESPTAELQFQSKDIKHSSKQDIERKQWTSLQFSAATKIQAVFRGYRIRRIIYSVLESARNNNSDDDDDDDDDFNYDEEVDLAAFDFDDDGNEWRPGDTPQLPPRTPALPSKKFSNDVKNVDIPDFPKHAWESTPATPQPSTVEKVERLDLELSPEHSDVASTVPESAVSKKKDELAMEWGFQNSNTADLMMKRAKKMKSSARKNNFLSLAPDKRYALFKKLQQSNSNMTVRPPAKGKPSQRVEYFSAQRETNSGSRLSNISTDRNFKDKMTYSWICNQAVLHSDAYQDIISEREKDHKTKMKLEAKQTKSKDIISLPYMDPAIIAGKNLPLVLLSSRNASNPSLASQPERKMSLDKVRKGHSSEKSRSAPNPSVRSPPVFNVRDSSSSRSSSSGSKGRKK